MMDSRLPSWIQFHLDLETQHQRTGTSLGSTISGPARSPSRSPKRGDRSPPSPISTSVPSSPTSSQSAWSSPHTEPPLIQAIRRGDYEQVLVLCKADPGQARPIPYQPLTLSPATHSPTSGNNYLWRAKRTATHNKRMCLFQPTALGIFCDQLLEPSHQPPCNGHYQAIAIVKELIQACPRQLRCSQRECGRTPLLQLIREAQNARVSIELVQVLLEADCSQRITDMPCKSRRVEKGDSYLTVEAEVGTEIETERVDFEVSVSNPLLPAVNQRDGDGMDVIDHILSAIQLGTVEPDKAMLLLQLLMEYHSTPEIQLDQLDDDAALLVRFFSLGTSFGYSPPSSRSPPSFLSLSSFSQDEMDTSGRLERILECTRRLLKWRRSLLHDKSALTHCTPLHIALRNYGNYDQLIRELLQNPMDSSWLTQQRNIYGDLPLHVACAVGVPMDMLHLILSRTLQASKEYATLASSRQNGPNALIWSKNLSGYTPVDLEWIRHIEAGNGFFSHRSFYPLDSRGVRMLPSGRAGELYKTLLRQAVDQIIVTNAGTNTAESIAAHLVARVDWTAQSNRAFGLLLHRIFLIIRSAFHDSFSTYPVDLSGDILHLAAALIRPTAPTLPRPIGELIRWQYPEELKRRDHLGRLPLHYCFTFTDGSSRFTRTDDSEATVALEWCEWVKEIIMLEPTACQIKDNNGRLALHYALLQECPPCPDVRLLQPVIKAMASVIETLVHAQPDSVEMSDPITGLRPFMLAASNNLLQLDMVFSLLQHAPGVFPSINRKMAQRKICRKRSLSTA